MNKNLILLCSALFAGALSSHADEKRQPPAFDLDLDPPVVEQSAARPLSVEQISQELAAKLTAKNKAAFIASCPLADASVFKPQGNTVLARVKLEGESRVDTNSEEQQCSDSLALDAEGNVAAQVIRISISNT